MGIKRKILVADRSHLILRVAEIIFTENGSTVLSVQTATACLAKAASDKPDLILLSYELADMNDMEICQTLIANPATREIPVVIMGSGSVAQRKRCFKLENVIDFLETPFTVDALYWVVQRTFPTKIAVTEAISRTDSVHLSVAQPRVAFMTTALIAA